MRQPQLLPSTNILPFPGVRAEEEESRPGAPEVGSRLASFVELPQGFTLSGRGAARGFLIVPLWTEDHAEKNCHALHGSPRSELPHLAPKGKRSIFVVSSWRLRALAVALIFIAVLPTLAAGVLWFAKSGMPSERDGHEKEPEAILILPKISTPAALRATAGDYTPFPISIDGSSDIGAGAVVAVSQLPRGATFSAGVPEGESNWKLREIETAGLRLVLPTTARGDMRLVTRLLAPDGHVISESATVVEVAGIDEAKVAIRRVKTEVIPAQVWDQPNQQAGE